MMRPVAGAANTISRAEKSTPPQPESFRTPSGYGRTLLSPRRAFANPVNACSAPWFVLIGAVDPV
jgi:hypothetical protein